MILAHGAIGSYDEIILFGAFLLLFLAVLLSGWLMSRREARGEETRNIDEAVRQSLEAARKRPAETEPPVSS